MLSTSNEIMRQNVRMFLAGTPRHGGPVRAAAGGTDHPEGPIHVKRCAAERGADSAARCPYHYWK